MAGHFRNVPLKAIKAFSDLPQFSGFMKPCRFEGRVNNLEIIGDIPREIDGTFYRVMPDPQLPPFIEDDPWFNGDGNISAFKIKDGHVDFQQRYVRTEKFVQEEKARSALLGKYRNPFTDKIKFAVRSTANTNIVYFGGKLLACKEDSPPYALDPETLETIKLWDFDGQLPSCTFTAHPKFDPVTGDMICFGYEAKGLGTPDICCFTFSPDGKLKDTVWFTAPVCGLIHDFAVTKNYVRIRARRLPPDVKLSVIIAVSDLAQLLFPIIPQISDVARMEAGGEHWQWDSSVPTYIGVLPRYGASGSDVKWFQSPNSFPGHTANAYENDEGRIIFDLAISTQNVFFWWPDAEGNAPIPQTISSYLSRFTIDPKATELQLPAGQILMDGDVEFPRIDDRMLMRSYTTAFTCHMDPRLGTDFPFISSVMGGGFPPYNSLAAINVNTGSRELYYPGPRYLVQECVFIPRKGSEKEADGFVMVLLNNYSEMISELAILDTAKFSKSIAIVKLPMSLRAGLHGNWVDAADTDGHPKIDA